MPPDRGQDGRRDVIGPPPGAVAGKSLDFQRPELQQALVELLASAAPAKVALLTGPVGIGRRHLTRAAVHELQARGQAWSFVDFDLDGYEPDAGSPAKYLEHLLAKRFHDDAARDEVRAPLLAVLKTLGPRTGAATAAFIATLLGLDRSAGEMAAALQALPPPPDREPSDGERLDALTGALVAGGSLVIYLGRAATAPLDLLGMLREKCDAQPRLALVLAAEAGDAEGLLPAGPARPPLRLELRPLLPPEIAASLRRQFPGAPADGMADALARVAGGLPHEIAARVGALLEAGTLVRDATGRWDLPDKAVDEAAPLVRVFSYPFFDPVDRLLRSLPEEQSQALRQFLAAAVVCGDNVPADAAFMALQLSQEGAEDMVDLIDDHLVASDGPPDAAADDDRVPVFHDFQFTHPGFPGIRVYSFLHPLFPAAIRDRLGLAERSWRAIGDQVRQVVQQYLPPRTRAVAEVHLQVLGFAADPQRAQHRLRLRWWVGQDQGARLTTHLAELLAARELDGQGLFQAALSMAGLWPGPRILALLDGYAGQPGGIPANRLREYWLVRAQIVLSTGDIRAGLRAAVRASRLAPASSLDLAVSLSVAGQAATITGKTRTGRQMSERALAIVESHQGAPPALKLQALWGLTAGLIAARDWAPARGAAENFLAVAEAHGDVGAIAAGLRNLADIHRARGDQAAAEAALARIESLTASSS